jgi:hypothetical protein
MRKQREKVMKEEEEARKRKRPFYFYSRDQQAAYAKFERDFVRRIDHILENKVVQLFFCVYFFGGLECFGYGTPLLMSPIFVFLRDFWIRTQRGAVPSRCATNLSATRLPTNLATHLPPYQLSHPSPCNCFAFLKVCYCIHIEVDHKLIFFLAMGVREGICVTLCFFSPSNVYVALVSSE